ncbi:MAG: cation acetate symporter, partial [SAR202 cluster bacterium]|nr:cation acetate symporter [SAR202 cluster bacterium]
SALKKGKVNEKDELFVSKISAVILGCVAIFLGILFEKQNVAFMVGLAFAVAASANFPVLFLSMYWKKLTSKGALIGGGAGLIIATTLVILGPAVWVDVFGYDKPIFPYKYPALFSMTTAFFITWLFSVMDKSKSSKLEIDKFDSQFIKSQIVLKNQKN